MPSPPAVDLLLATLECRGAVSPEERALVRGLEGSVRRFSRREELIVVGSRPVSSCLVTAGMAARVVGLADGSRQICSLHVPGDFVDLHGLLLKQMDHSVVTLTPGYAVYYPHEQLREITRRSPHLTRMLWLLTMIDAAIQRSWIASLGRRSAQAHLCHLLCELCLRLDVVGLAARHRFEFALKQGDLADVLGISTVHANRCVQQLRADKLIRWLDRSLEILDFRRLAEAAEFDPLYLNLHREPR